MGRRAGNTALWIDVGLDMFILEERWATISGSRPEPVNVEESRGALLGFACADGKERKRGCSIFGLEVKREEMTWCGRRVEGAVVMGSPKRSWLCSSGPRSLRGRFAGRTSVMLTVASLLLGAGASVRVLRFATRLAFSLWAMRMQSRHSR